MKILLASSSSGSRGGGEVYLVYLARALVHRGHQLTLWLSSHPRMDELAALLAPSGRVIRTSYRNTYDRRARSVSTFFDHDSARRIAREWNALDFDCVHVNKQNLEDGLDLLSATRLLRRPAVCTIHLTQSARYLGAEMAWVRDVVARRALRRFPGTFITVLEERSRDLARFLGGGRHIVTVPNGVPIYSRIQLGHARDKARAMLHVTPEELLIVAVGRMVDQKRPLLFVEIARRILARVPRARFLWVGDGPLAQAWDGATQGEPRIRRLPWQSEVMPFLSAADAFLHVADYEGLPLALLEGMAAGLPCAVTPNLLDEMPFLDRSTSIVAHLSTDEWMNVFDDSAELRRRGEAARQLVERDFSYDRMASACEALYREGATR